MARTRVKRGRDGIRRLTRSKRARRGVPARIPRSVQRLNVDTLPVPSTQTTRFKYVSYNAFDAGAGLASTQVFSANGMYDPDITGAGHQPRGFDQIMTMYQFYSVKRAWIEVQVISGPTATGQPCLIFLSASPQSAPYSTSIYDYAEQPTTVFKVHSGDASGKSVLKMQVDVPQMLGTDIKDANLKGSNAANPGNQIYFHISQTATDFSVENPGPVTCIVTIIYEALLSGRYMANVS